MFAVLTSPSRVAIISSSRQKATCRFQKASKSLIAVHCGVTIFAATSAPASLRAAGDIPIANIRLLIAALRADVGRGGLALPNPPFPLSWPTDATLL
jgi:hypothetical protein